MADLSAMYMNLANNTARSTERGMLGAQQFMENQLAYQKAREDLEAQRGLRALFAEKPNATSEEVSRYSPQLGMEMNKYAQEAQERSGRITKNQREISDMEAKAVAETLGPIAERAMLTGDINAYHREIGQAASALQQQGIQLPMNFDPGQHTPDIVLRNSVGRGYKSPLMENQMAAQREQMISQVPPRMTPSQARGEVELDPVTGQPVFKPPLPRQPRGTGMAGAPAAQIPNGFERATAEDIPTLQEAYDSATDINEKQQIGALLNQLKQQTGGMPMAGQVDRAKYKGEEAAAVETARETAKAEVTRGEEGKRITDSFKRAIGEGGVSRVMKLISESTSGPTEEFAANVISGIPRPGGSKATTGMENIGSLTTIAKELKKTIERSPGPQSDKDVALDALAAAAIDNQSIPYNQRMKGFLEFTRIIKERADDLGIDPKEIGIDVDVNTGSSIPTAKTESNIPIAKTEEEAENFVKTLKPGQSFIGPEGKTHTIKGR